MANAGKKANEKPFGEVVLEDFEAFAKAGITNTNIKAFMTKAAIEEKE